MFWERRVDCGRHRKLRLRLEWEKKKWKDWVIPLNENDSKTRYNQLMSMKRYLAHEKRSLPWRIIELKKLKKNWCIDFFFWHAKNFQEQEWVGETVAAVRE